MESLSVEQAVFLFSSCSNEEHVKLITHQEVGIVIHDVLDALSYVPLDCSPFRGLDCLDYEALNEYQAAILPHLTLVSCRIIGATSTEGSDKDCCPCSPWRSKVREFQCSVVMRNLLATDIQHGLLEPSLSVGNLKNNAPQSH